MPAPSLFLRIGFGGSGAVGIVPAPRKGGTRTRTS